MNKVYLIATLTIFCLITAPGVAQTADDVTPEVRAEAMEYFIQGVSDFENEDYERALDHLTAAHLKLSDDPGINYALSDVYLMMGDYNNASYYAQIAADREPENRWYQLQLAEIYRQSGRYEAIIDIFDQILKYHPDDVDILFMKSQAYVEFGELEKSNETLDRLIDIRGSEFEFHLRKFQNYNALQQRDKALEQLEIMRELNPGNLSTLHTISQYYLELGDEESALETLLDARERNPRDPQTLILLAEIYIDREQWDELGQTFISMIEDPLLYPSQKMELVQFLYSQHRQQPAEQTLTNQTENAITAFSRSEPEFAPAQMIAAEFHLQQNNLELALETLERAAEANPTERGLWGQRLQVMFSMQQYEKIIEISETALEYAGNDAYVLFFIGASYMLTDQPEEAAESFEAATSAPAQRNFRSVIYGTYGDVLQDLDRWEDAKEAYEMALRLDRNNHNALNNYAYFLSVRNERLTDALEMAETAISFEPENSAYLDTLGWIHFKLGNYEDAKSYIEQAITTGDAGAEVYEHLGDIHSELGNREEAKNWWQQALELDPDREYLKKRLN
ncbi:tetratricopeptide repeat protein [Rhodohalobacter halophilus]|uniref:tetratricopeptide repeat protein n=1 Tax=Rhodohalobacter halophilus TaxID=1812810 RepID=UPI00083F8AD6|nr:tetratricopeptide repeat protein [Rhodohalobacter halophilus]